jgi:ABC-type transport system involved in multi-copper enzyme maturation permease subunit
MDQLQEQTPSPPVPAAALADGKRARGAARIARAWAAVGRAALDNPVLVKEFRTRMRGTRAYWVLLGYTLLLAGVLAIMYFSFEAGTAAQRDVMAGGTYNTQAARDLGQWIFWFVFIAQSIMVALITPAITAGAVTIEREQRSYELLVTTPLRPADIIRGKMSAAVSFVVLLLTASLPLVSLSFLVGGVSPAEIFFSYLIIALAAFVYGAVGIFWSAALKTTAVATVVTYLTVLSSFVLSMVPGLFAQMSALTGTGAMPEAPFQSINPLMATFRAVQPEYFFSGQLPSWVGASILNVLLGMLVANAAMGRLEHFEPPPPVWTRVLATLLWCAAMLFFFAPMLGGMVRSWSAAADVTQGVGQMLMVMLVFLLLATPVFNTGDLVVRRGESALARYLRGFAPHRALGNDLSCGLPLILGWALFLLALIPVAAAVGNKWGLFVSREAFVPGAVLCLCVVLGLAGIGNLLSVTLPSRWAACVLTYLAAVVLMLLPYFTLFPWYQLINKPTTPGLLWQVLYFVPFEGLVQLSSPGSFWIDHPPMLFGRTRMWIVTSGLYLAIAAACFLFTAARIRSVGRQLQERMDAREAAFQAP